MFPAPWGIALLAITFLACDGEGGLDAGLDAPLPTFSAATDGSRTRKKIAPCTSTGTSAAVIACC